MLCLQTPTTNPNHCALNYSPSGWLCSLSSSNLKLRNNNMDQYEALLLGQRAQDAFCPCTTKAKGISLERSGETETYSLIWSTKAPEPALTC